VWESSRKRSNGKRRRKRRQAEGCNPLYLVSFTESW